jgi:NAD(P)H-hydrate epimerase
MIVTGAEMKALEERAFAEGVDAETLMNEAGQLIAEVVNTFFPVGGKCVVHFGKGHNGGDALVAAALLSDMGWEIELRPAFPRAEWAPLTQKKHDEIKVEMPPDVQKARLWLREHRSKLDCVPLIVLDGLLGIGAGGPLRGAIRDGAQAINQLRMHKLARVFALDLPTGVNADTGEVDADAVIADFTLTVGYAKAGLFSDAATRHVGRLVVLPLDDLTLDEEEDYTGRPILAHSDRLRTVLPLRNFDLHKGQCGRVGIVAGSRGMLGAAHLTADACLAMGAGLVTLFVTEDIYPLIATCAASEIMVQPVQSYLEVLDARLDVLAIGPGLGLSRASEIRQLIERAPQPTILDADALNILAGHLHLLERCAGPRLLTPHPGEMARLDPLSAQRSRRATVEAFTARWPHTLLLKGARTLIGQREYPLSYNSTGSPGMATGGMGDTLTGVCAALAGQGLGLYDAARLGAWLCGYAAELSTNSDEAEESITPGGLIASLGSALFDLRRGCW